MEVGQGQGSTAMAKLVGKQETATGNTLRNGGTSCISDVVVAKVQTAQCRVLVDVRVL